jgi:succinoglycan biosynthesis transport protein ExoP
MLMESKVPVPVERHEPAAYPVETAYVPAEPSPGERGPHIPRVLLRRWKLVLVASVVICAVFLPAIWLLIKPEFTATGAIQVAPVVPRIVFKDVSEFPAYDTYMNTQAELMASRFMLMKALDEPRLAELRQRKDAEAVLERGLLVTATRGTQLLRVSMTSTDAMAAADIVNAIMRAYLSVEGGSETTTEDQTLETLERERTAAADKLQGLHETIYQLSERGGAPESSAGEKIALSQVQVLQEELVRIETSRLALEAKAQLLDASAPQETRAAELARLRNDYVRTDPVATALTAKVTDLEQQLDLAVDRWENENKTQRELMKKGLESLRAKLEAKRAEVEKQFDDMTGKQQEETQQNAKEETQQGLALLKAQKDRIEDELKKQNEQVAALGLTALAVKKVEDELGLTRDLYQRISERIQELRVERQRPGRVRIAYQADMPSVPSRDKRLKYSIVLVMGAVLCGCALAVGRHELTQPVEAPHDVEERCGLPVLGTLPRFEDLHRGHLPARNLLDDCRTIWVNLSLTKQGGLCRVLVVTSAQSRDGKTSFAINFATSMALMGRRVLLIDGDLRKPDVARYLNAEYEVGLSDVLAGTCPVEEVLHGTDLPVLDVLPSGRKAAEREEPLADGRLAELLEDLRKRYDEIVVDTPPVLAVSDAKLWARHADGVVFVARSGWSAGRDLLEATRRMRGGGATVSGVVITGVRAQDSYERYQHRYAQVPDKKQDAKKGANGGVFLVIDDVRNGEEDKKA